MRAILHDFIIFLGLAVILVVVYNITIQASVVQDISMQPTLVAGQRLIIVKVFYNFNEPQRGDIVIVRPPIDPNREFVKRLIGLPGDTVVVKNRTVYVNNIPLSEPYLKAPPNYEYGPFTVPENHYFLLGDNRNNSSDSHLNWTVTRQDIIGKACLRVWPPDKWGGPGSYPLNDELADHNTTLTSN